MSRVPQLDPERPAQRSPRLDPPVAALGLAVLLVGGHSAVTQLRNGDPISAVMTAAITVSVVALIILGGRLLA